MFHEFVIQANFVSEMCNWVMKTHKSSNDSSITSYELSLFFLLSFISFSLAAVPRRRQHVPFEMTTMTVLVNVVVRFVHIVRIIDGIFIRITQRLIFVCFISVPIDATTKPMIAQHHMAVVNIETVRNFSVYFKNLCISIDHPSSLMIQLPSFFCAICDDVASSGQKW